MVRAAEIIERILVPILFGGGWMLVLLLGYLFIQRAVRGLAQRRRQRLISRYRPLVDTIVQHGPAVETLTRLRRVPASHRSILADLLLAPLHATRGPVVSHLREAAAAIGLVDEWKTQRQHRHWWRRADSVRALGLVEEPSALPLILRALDDEHKEVRAAAVDAAGRLGDDRAIPALLAHLTDAPHYQRVRIVDALWSLGPAVTPALVDLARTRPDCTRLVADVLGMIGTTTAIDPLLEWCADPRSEVRAAALSALGSLGLDDRSYYFAVKALGDADPLARAMAARALGRGRREDAAGYLAARLDDEWLPAAQAAGALRQLGAPGRVALLARAHDEGQAGDLARQMLWTQQAAVAGA